MKKLAISAAVVIMAVASQAAQFSWKTANFMVAADSSGNAITTAAGFNTMLNGGSIVAVLVDGDTFTDLGTSTFKTSGSAAQKYGISGSYAFTAGASNPFSDGDIIQIMFKDSTGAYSWLKDGDGNDIVAQYTVSGFDDYTPQNSWTGSFTFGTAGTSGSPNTFTAVPEPTSGLLMLLGMAGLALRRRRA